MLVCKDFLRAKGLPPPSLRGAAAPGDCFGPGPPAVAPEALAMTGLKTRLLLRMTGLKPPPHKAKRPGRLIPGALYMITITLTLSYASIFAYFARDSMNSLRGGTSSPISMLKILAAS